MLGRLNEARRSSIINIGINIGEYKRGSTINVVIHISEYKRGSTINVGRLFNKKDEHKDQKSTTSAKLTEVDRYARL